MTEAFEGGALINLLLRIIFNQAFVFLSNKDIFQPVPAAYKFFKKKK